MKGRNSCISALTLLCIFSASLLPHGLEILLEGVTLQLTRDASCCGSCSESSYDTTQAWRIDSPCKCDPFCVMYGDCCLDYALFCTDIEPKTSGNTLVGIENCTIDRVNVSFTNEGEVSTYAEDQCGAYREEATHGFVREYLCQLRALWLPVILKQRSTKHFVSAPGDNVYMLIQDCSLDASEDELHACEMERPLASVQHILDIVSILPVTAANGLHYKNKQCALCNGYDSQNVIFWTILFFCHPRDLDLNFVFRSNVSLVATKCKILAVESPKSFPWEVAPLRKMSSVSHHCKDSPNGDACRAYSLPYRGYTNMHCSLCGSNRNTSSVGDNNSTHHNSEPPVSGQRSLSALFDFSPSEGAGLSSRRHGTIYIKPTCEHGQTYDQSTGECREFYCPYGQVFADDGFTCVSLGNQTNNSSRFDTRVPDERFSCEVFIQTEFPVDEKNTFASFLFQQILGDVLVNISDLKLDDSNKTDPNQCCSSIKMPHAYILSVVAHVGNTTSIESMSTLVLDALNKTKCWEFTNISLSVSTVIIRNFDKVFLQNRCAKQGRELKQYTLDVYLRFLLEGVSYIRFLLDNETYVLPSLEIRQEITHASEKKTGQSVSTCSAKLICPIIVLNSNEFKVTTMGSVLMYRDAAGRNLSSHDVIVMSHGKIAVCRSDIENPNNPQDKYDTSEIIVSMVGVSISLVFILMSLITYYVFPELRNLPGKNMMSFLVAMFALLMTFLLSVGSPLSHVTLTSNASCLIFAVLMHYFLLAVFFWSNIISLHFVRTFGIGVRMRLKGSLDDWRAFRLYSVYGWGAPIVIVGVGCALHFLAEIDGRRENVYNGCNISGGDAAVYLVAVPLSILMCLNAVFFTVTLVGIKKTRRDVKMVREKKGRLETFHMELSLFVKTFVATGLLWFGIFIVGYFEDRAFSYVVTVIFTLQGPMAFFAFAFNGRVRGMWAKKLSSAPFRAGQSTEVYRVSAISTRSTLGSSKREADHPEMDTQLKQAVITCDDRSQSESTFNNPMLDST